MAKIIIEHEGKIYETVPDEKGYEEDACDKKCALKQKCDSFRLLHDGKVLCIEEPFQGEGYVHFEEVINNQNTMPMK